MTSVKPAAASALMASALMFLHCASAIAQTPPTQPAPPPILVKHAEPPSSTEYWNFNRWYLDHVIVNLVVSGTDTEGLVKALGELSELKKRNVLIGRIIVVGGENFALLNGATSSRGTELAVFSQLRDQLRTMGKDLSLNDFYRLKDAIGVSTEVPRLAAEIELGTPRGVGNIQEILDALQIESSPTWIVRYHGKNYIYEGVTEVSRYFTKQGQFTDGER
ncbi:MAG: hypothetical protein U0136_13770 [Bdellovibrionota bacterium]